MARIRRGHGSSRRALRVDHPRSAPPCVRRGGPRRRRHRRRPALRRRPRPHPGIIDRRRIAVPRPRARQAFLGRHQRRPAASFEAKAWLGQAIFAMLARTAWLGQARNLCLSALTEKSTIVRSLRSAGGDGANESILLVRREGAVTREIAADASSTVPRAAALTFRDDA